MTPLDERAEGVLGVARSEHQPSAADTARVRNALAGRLRAEPLLIDAPSAAPLGARALAGKWLVALALGGAAGFAAGFLVARATGPLGTAAATKATSSGALASADTPSAPVVREMPPLVAPSPLAPEPVREEAPRSLEGTPESAPGPAPTSARALSSRPSTEPRSSASSLQAELDGLRRAQELLHRGQAAWAIARLDELERAHVGSVLEEERLATRAIAECTLGRDRAAQLGEFARRFPRSAHLEQVRASCSADTAPDSAEKRAPPQTESSASPH